MEVMEVKDYNKLFEELKKECKKEHVSNAFSCISIEELKELNNLLWKIIEFCDDISDSVLKEYKCGDEILKLQDLIDVLFLKDYLIKNEL